MNVKETVILALEELIIPELDSIKEDNKEIKPILTLTNKRLDDHNAHLVDLSRKIDALRVELKEEIGKNTSGIDETNRRTDRLYEVVVKKEEHIDIVRRVTILEEKIKEIERKVA